MVDDMNKALMRTLKRECRPKGGLWVTALLLFLFTSILMNFLYVQLQIVVDSLVDGNYEKLMTEMVKIAMFAFIYFVLMFIAQDRFKILIRKSKINTKLYFYNRILDKEVTFFDKSKTGEMMSKIFQESNEIAAYIAAFDIVTIGQVVALVGSLGIMFYFNALLTTIILFMIVVFFVSTGFIAGIFSKLERDEYSISANNNHFLMDTIKGIKDIKILKTENFFYNKMDNKMNKVLLPVSNKAAKYEALYTSIFAFLVFVLPLIGITMGVYFVYLEQLSIGELIVFYPLIVMLQEPTRILSQQVSDHKRVSELLKRNKDILECNDEGHKRKGITELARLLIKIDKFRYDGEDDTILSDFNLELKSNDIVCVKGASGCGKSTLIKLIMKFVEYSEDSILVNNVPINEISRNSLYDFILMQSQTPFIFEGTLIENLTLGVDYQDYEIAEVVQVTQLEDFIDQYGFQHEISEDGRNLSGGQIQRISLARLLLRKSKLILLDEPTSALDDSTAENLVNELVKYFKKHNTIALIVSHKEDFDEVCNQIINL
jgi:ABC-type bacteriocin/lantibiotic exporter with double-glycine peptidase domain